MRRAFLLKLSMVFPLLFASACNKSADEKDNDIVIDNNEIYLISKKGIDPRSKLFIGNSTYHFSSSCNYAFRSIIDFSSSFYGFYQDDFSFEKIDSPINSYFSFDCQIMVATDMYHQRNGYGAFNNDQIKLYRNETYAAPGSQSPEAKTFLESEITEPLSYALDFHYDTFNAIYDYFDCYYNYGNDKSFYSKEQYANYNIVIFRQTIGEKNNISVLCSYYSANEYYETVISFAEGDIYLLPYKIKCCKTFIGSNYFECVSENMVFEHLMSFDIPHSQYYPKYIKDVKTIEKPTDPDVIILDDSSALLSTKKLYFNTIVPYLSRAGIVFRQK